MKKKIAIVAGGDSSEVVVSLKSAAGLNSFFDHNQYDVYLVVLKQKNWYVALEADIQISIDKNDFSFLYNNEKICFDFAYITIHGTPGENGLLQGYFELIGLPYSGCQVLASALTFNKFSCNHYLKAYGISIAESLLLRKGQTIAIQDIEDRIGFPCFIKPNEGGSSFGVTKVKTQDQVEKALNDAFNESDEVMIEAFMPGTEVTCGIYSGLNGIRILPVTEVVTPNEFFNFDAKYNGQVEEITPARLSDDLTNRIQQLTRAIYEILGCKGIIRNDYIIGADNTIRLLEVNTTPGMTPTSFIPQQVRAAGLEMKDVLSEIIEKELQN